MDKNELLKSFHEVVRSILTDCCFAYYTGDRDGIFIHFFDKEIFLPTEELIDKRKSAKDFYRYVKAEIFKGVNKS